MSTKKENTDNKNLKESNPDVDSLIDEIKKDDNFGKAIEAIFASKEDPNIIKDKITLLIQQYLKTKHIDKTEKEIAEIEKRIEEKISKIAKKFIHRLAQENNIDIDTQNKDPNQIKAEKDYKRIVTGFVVYEIYKAMNPKRIAGETKKDNYKNNLSKGGEKLASKYEGGKAPDLKKYGENEVKNIKNQVKEFKKYEGWKR